MIELPSRQFSTIAPIKRGLKVVFHSPFCWDDLVSTIAPIKRGLKAANR